MTREEAKKSYSTSTSNVFDFDKFIDKIYDNFNQRNCGSCIYCSEFDATYSYNDLRCEFGLGTINEYGTIFTELDFGCNKWSKK